MVASRALALVDVAIVVDAQDTLGTDMGSQLLVRMVALRNDNTSDQTLDVTHVANMVSTLVMNVFAVQLQEEK